MRKIKYGKFLLLLIFVMSIVYSGGDVGSSKVVHADQTTETNETTYKNFYKELPKSDIDLEKTFELITPNRENSKGINHGSSLDEIRKDVVIITRDKQWQFGGLWYKNPIDMKKNFSMLMYVNLGHKWNNGDYVENNTRGGDGITFTIQGHTNKSGVALEETIGANGAGLGAYSKAPDNNDPFNDHRNKFISNALVLEFDTFYNNREELPYTNDNGTPNFGNGGEHGKKFYGHIDLTETPAWSEDDQKTFYKVHDSSADHFRYPKDLQDATDQGQDLTDGQWRKVEVSWNSSTYELTYNIAGYDPIVYKFENLEDVKETFGGTKVHWGFTGSTGDSFNLQQVGIFKVPDQTESSIKKLARNITKDEENAEFKEKAIMKLGDIIEYQVTVDYPKKYITQELIEKENTQEMIAAVIEDKLPAGLEYVGESLGESLRVQKNDSDITPELKNDEIHLGDLKPGDTFVVTYQAVVTEEGVIDNTATFYSRYTNPIDDTATVYSRSINILKVNETDQLLDGAEFTIEGEEPNNFNVTIPRSEEDLPASYKVETLEPGSYKLNYLEPGKYTITETKAPNGYLPAAAQTVTVEKGTVDLKITFKNYEEPGVFKEQRNLNETEWGEKTTTLVGETVDFRLSATAPTDIKEYKKFALSDQIDARLNYTPGSTKKVYINDPETPLVADEDYVLTEPTEENDGTLEVSLTEAGIARLTAEDKLYVEFSAVVNDSALGAEPIENRAIVNWDNNKGHKGDKKSVPTTTILKEGSITIKKVAMDDNDLLLEGAIFKLQRLENREWQDVANSSQTTDETGVLTWNRLVSGEYRLVETKAPTGYNLLVNPIEFTIDDGDNLTHKFLVENIPQEVLPQTGGIGTVVFTITGLLLMMSAGLSSLITRIKKNNYKKGV